MNRLMRVLKSPPILATLALVVLVTGWSIWNAQASSERISPGLAAAVARGDKTVDVVVQVDFKLEAFHINYFQGRGRVSRVQDSQISLRRVPVTELPAIARNYWITRISLPDEVN